MPAEHLVITPSCTSSAISFNPSTITFEKYSSTQQIFNISAANGLSGEYNVTFTKTEGTYTFYADMQYLTLNVYVPTTKYWIRINSFVSKSIGTPITVNIDLEVASPTTFALLATSNCSSYFAFDPTSRINVPAQATKVSFTVTFTGASIPSACYQTFKISSLTTNNYYIETQTVYYSASLSIDKTWVESPMVLELSTTPKESADVGHTIISSTSVNTEKYAPTVYKISTSTIGSNVANFIATTSYSGAVYYAVVMAGTPKQKVNIEAIKSNTLESGIAYGSSSASLQNSGVNIESNLAVSGLKAQTSYIIAAYLQSTTGDSPIYFLNFKTAKISNAAAIKIAMSTTIN